MKQLSTWLSNPIGQDLYGTSGLTGLQFIIALSLVLSLFAWCLYEDRKDKKRESHEPWNQ